jgi:hypothetical protein
MEFPIWQDTGRGVLGFCYEDGGWSKEGLIWDQCTLRYEEHGDFYKRQKRRIKH